MTREEYDAINTARQLNSISLALAEFSTDDFRVLFYNTAFEKLAHSAGMFTRVFTQEMLCQPQPYHMLTRNIVNLMDSVKVDGDGKMLFTINEEYYEIRARRMAQTEDKFCALIGITNLTKDTQSEKTGYLDDSVRQIYALYERITLLNHPEDTIKPLYTGTREDLLSNRRGIKKLVNEYAERYIYPEDKAQFVQVFNPDTAIARLSESGSVGFSEVFRTSVRHGQYAWKEYTLLKIDADNYFLLVRNIHDIAKDFISGNAVKLHEGGPYAPEQLWSNLVRSELFRIFWKDRDRRFLGASKGFLDFYGFSSAEEIVGKNDEEMGWHVPNGCDGLHSQTVPGHRNRQSPHRQMHSAVPEALMSARLRRTPSVGASRRSSGAAERFSRHTCCRIKLVATGHGYYCKECYQVF